VQANEATAKRIELLLPWEINPTAITVDQRFDDWHEAIRAFSPRHLQRKTPAS
jgi:hypothetical protein